jgi:hypothetical protein
VAYTSVVDVSAFVPELCIADGDPRYHKHGKHISKPACGVDPGFEYTEVMTENAETPNKPPSRSVLTAVAPTPILLETGSSVGDGYCPTDDTDPEGTDET